MIDRLSTCRLGDEIAGVWHVARCVRTLVLY